MNSNTDNNQNDNFIQSKGKVYVCNECGNENNLPEDVQIEQVVECQFCGIEYKVVEQNEEGYKLETIEEEK